MNCSEVRDLLPLYHYGELEGDERRVVEEHTLSCDTCRKELASVRAALDAIVPPEVPAMSDEFWVDNVAQIMGRIERAPTRRFYAPLWFAAAAAIALLVVAGYLNTDAPVQAPAQHRVTDSELVEIAMTIEMDSVSEQIESFWNDRDETVEGFDAEFGDALGNIEESIDVMMFECLIFHKL